MVEIDGVGYKSSTRLPDKADKSAQYLLLRLLLGTLEVNAISQTVAQRINYLKFSFGPQSLSNADAVAEFLNNFSLTYRPAEFVRRTIGDNRSFYRDLLSEFAHFFLQTDRKSHVAAFVFLYRILERLSYSLPLLYCSRATEYKETFDILKNLLTDAGGDLSFFKKFLREARLIDNLVLDSSYDFRFVSQRGYAGRYYTAVTTRFGEIKDQDDVRLELKIQFRHISDLIITLRNRFLHTRTGDGKNNILLSEIRDPEEFFSLLNPMFCSFLALVALHILGKKYA